MDHIAEILHGVGSQVSILDTAVMILVVAGLISPLWEMLDGLLNTKLRMRWAAIERDETIFVRLGP